MFQSKTMRRIQLQSNSRRKRRPLRIGLFIIYVLVQYITCAKIPEELTSTYPSSTDREENWTVESTLESFTTTVEVEETIIKELPPVENVAKEMDEKNEGGNKEEEVGEKQQQEEKGKEEKIKEEEKSKEANEKSKEELVEKPVVPKKEVTTILSKNVPRTTTVPSTTTVKYERATWRPRRENCSPPAIEQFPRPLMGPDARKHGGLIIHILAAIYTFLGLAIVCDDYFVSSLDRICEELRLSPDVAGATFMAAGSSAPELATVVIGVFFAKDDIGEIITNIAVADKRCDWKRSIQYNVRDIGLRALHDNSVKIELVAPLPGLFLLRGIDIGNARMESLFMLIMYGVYCVALSFNTRLERWAKSYNIPFLPKDDEPAEESALVSYRSLQEDRLSYTGPCSPTDQYKTHEAATGGPTAPETNEAAPPKQPEYYKAKEPDPNEISPLEKPTDGSKWTLFTWGLVYPIHFMCRATMPDCRQEKFRNWYPFTFCVSMVWISFYSYIMVWMITIIGSTLGIPDTMMGLTFVAAGVSVPDALSSLAVIKEGLGDMAVSNAVGSNVFDILVCLGLPWFIQTAMIQPGSHVNVTSRGLTYSTVSLLSTVIFLVLATHLNGWKLDRRYGVILMIWYLKISTLDTKRLNPMKVERSVG
ncbi:sodium/potassium/calcium exchanger [Apis cerana cerana]|uniref:Sodium/potassium/calcium exchanger n=1 Tax=Apis cerana cerana TaxID=94128 RepID=A0A2A3EIY0_APICC|nr:sodium/potassium/calcium exchanger [Apis cerana cerana]